jgi:hypothetical protein
MELTDEQKDREEAPKPARDQQAAVRALTGRQIVSVDLQTFDGGENRSGACYDPVLTLDNGSMVSFDVQETDVGVYGTRLVVRKGFAKRVVVSLTPAEAAALQFAAENSEDDEILNDHTQEIKLLASAIKKLRDARKGA